MARALLALALLFSGFCSAADPQWIAAFGRAAESQETDIVRLGYRHPLPERAAWWMPTHAQFGVDLWRVPDIRGTTRRFDLSASAIWRNERNWGKFGGYLEGGFGGYLLSKTINNDEHRLPSSFQFGSHLGVGMRLGRSSTIGIALQHLSNAGIKQPNGGIDLLLLQYTVSTGTPNR